MPHRQLIARRTPVAVVMLGVLIVCLLWTALLYDIRRAENAALEQGRRDVAGLALGFREHANGIVNAIDQLMLAIAADHARDPDAYRIPAWVDQSPLLHGLALQVAMTGPDGILRVSNLPFAGRVDLSDRPHVRYHLDPSAPQPFISAPVLGRVSGKWSIQFTRRLARSDGSFDGVVVVSADPSQLAKFFDSIDLGIHGSAKLVGLDGIVRAERARNENNVGLDLSKYALMEHVRRAGAGTYRTVNRIDGIERVFGYAKLQTYPLVVVIGLATDELLSRVREQKKNYLLFGGAATLAMVALTLFLVREAERRRRNELVLHAQAHVQAQKAQLDAALNNMPHGLAMFDRDQRLIVRNARFAEMYRLSDDAAPAGCTVVDVLKARAASGTLAGDPVEHAASITAQNSAGKAGQFSDALPDGRFVAVSSEPIPGGGWVCIHEDVTESHRSAARIAHLAHYDALTDLPNRILVLETIEQRLADLQANGKPFAVFIFDLDQFKTVNDSLGHAIGDALLQAIAARLRRFAGDHHLIGRLGGDEFAVIQRSNGDPRREAVALAETLLQEIGAPYDIDGHPIVIGISIGIALAPANGDSANLLLKHADLALYRRKSEGRNGYRFFAPEMDEEARQRHELELDLRTALARGEFEIHYQVIHGIRSRKPCGAEALVRWRHPLRGLVRPDQFIPIAEDTGLIIPLGEWILRQACRQAAAWPGQIRLAVNLSPVQFRSTRLVAVIAEALAAAGLRPDRLELEITESVLLQKHADNIHVLDELGSLGVKTVLDDFGTGYSSLSYLRMHRFSKIKIDRTFTAEMSQRADCASIVAAVTGLARSLGMDTTAEGVETWDQFELLKAAGCDQVQGFLFSRPQDARNLTFESTGAQAESA